MTTSITFPQPADRLSLNDRMHWARKAELTRHWRNAAHIAARSQLRPAQRPQPPSFVQVAFPVTTNRRRDPHNAAPTIKATIDGLTDAGVWRDDSSEYVIVLDPVFTKRADQIVTVTLTPIPPMDAA